MLYGRVDGSNGYISLNGGSESSAAMSAPANQRYWRIGATSGGTGVPPSYLGNETLDGWVAEVVGYNADLSSGEKTDVLNYLNTKWSVY